MWAAGEETHQGNSNIQGAPSSSNSSSKSSSASSSPSHFASSPLLPSPRRKTMEEVWKDISLTNLQDNPARQDGPRSNSGSSFRNIILQDFLARPFKETTAAAVPDIDIGLFAPTPPPPTVLSLNSGPDFQYVDSMPFQQHPRSSQAQQLSHHCCGNSSSANLSSSLFAGSSPTTVFEAFRSGSGQKRMPESESNSNDRRHKRMIKNRESAARSRARKQAYTNELELEVAHLLKENARLRQQQQKFSVAASAQLPPKHSLYRTSTAPF